MVIKRINKGDSCLKRVLRIKNMFLVNKHELGDKNDSDNLDWLHNYADIKLNVKMMYNNRCMVVECQFLVCFFC